MTGQQVIAIDGAAGAGKSTLARGLALHLGMPYVNTGEMYRAVAAAARRASIDPGDAAGLERLARGLRFRLTSPSGEHGPALLEVEGWSSAELHVAEVEATVSEVAAHPAVRAVLRDAQRRLAAEGAVMEGRDIGSVVAPDAPVKIFVRADADARARRRAAERVDDRAGEVADALHARDRRDDRTNRLEPAPDATVIDTTELDVAAALDMALEVVRRSAPELLP